MVLTSDVSPLRSYLFYYKLLLALFSFLLSF